MSIKWCCISSCKNSDLGMDKEISFHPFPRSLALLTQWIEKCGKDKNWCPDSSSVICSKHFQDDDFEIDLRAELLSLPPNNILNDEAIPSLYLYNQYPESETGNDLVKEENIIDQVGRFDEADNEEEEYHYTIEEGVEFIQILKSDYDSLKKDNQSLEEYNEILKNTILEKEEKEKQMTAKILELNKRIEDFDHQKFITELISSSKFKSNLKRNLMTVLSNKEADIIFKKTK